jgi:hypothetical protein
MVCGCILSSVLNPLLIDKMMCRDGGPHNMTLLGVGEERRIYFYVEETFK